MEIFKGAWKDTFFYLMRKSIFKIIKGKDFSDTTQKVQYIFLKEDKFAWSELSMMLSGEWKDKPLIERKYLQIVYLIKHLYPDYIKNTLNSIIRKKTDQYKKMGKRFEQITQEDIWKDGK